MGSRTWAILTGEYPPACGGVSDYSRQVARGLVERGEEVFVFAPRVEGDDPTDAGVTIHRLPDRFGIRSLRQLSAQLDTMNDPRILVQYVPHAFGCRAMNVPFALWLAARSYRNRIAVMFHEVAYPFERNQPLRHKLIASVNRFMAKRVVRACDRIFVSIPAWIDLLESLGISKSCVEVTPIPSNIPVEVDPNEVARLRQSMVGPNQILIGHFGTFGVLITPMLREILPRIVRGAASRKLLLIGRGSDEFAATLGIERDRLIALGARSANEVAHHLAACDLLVQPYPDGISGRRSTATAGLALGVPIVSNLGALSESFWKESDSVALAASPSAREIAQEFENLLTDESRRQSLSAHAGSLYRQTFAIEQTIDRLMQMEDRATHV